jgi:hypothetical protein
VDLKNVLLPLRSNLLEFDQYLVTYTFPTFNRNFNLEGPRLTEIPFPLMVFKILWESVSGLPFLSFYQFSSSLEILLKFICLYKSLMILFLMFVSSSLILSFTHYLFCSRSATSFTSYIVQRLSPFIWLDLCNNCNIACFLRRNNFEHSSSNCFYVTLTHNYLHSLLLTFWYSL